MRRSTSAGGADEIVVAAGSTGSTSSASSFAARGASALAEVASVVKVDGLVFAGGRDRRHRRAAVALLDARVLGFFAHSPDRGLAAGGPHRFDEWLLFVGVLGARGRNPPRRRASDVASCGALFALRQGVIDHAAAPPPRHRLRSTRMSTRPCTLHQTFVAMRRAICRARRPACTGLRACALSAGQRPASSSGSRLNAFASTLPSARAFSANPAADPCPQLQRSATTPCSCIVTSDISAC